MKRIITITFFMIFCFYAYSGVFGDENRFFLEASYTDTFSTTSVFALGITFDEIDDLSRPIFFLEGFDALTGTDDAMTVVGLEERLIASGLKQTLLNDGYTIVLVDLTSNWNSIQNQGKAFGNLMQLIWDRSKKIEPLKILGFSMGGLVSTETIATRTNTNPLSWDFDSNLLITYDSPHSGAYVPKGIYGFSKFFKDISDDAEQLYNAITSLSAKEMLLLGFTSQARAQHDTWQAYYDTRLDIVEGISGLRFVGFVNGSWNGVSQSSGSEGELTLAWIKYFPFIFDIFIALFSQGRPDKLAASCRFTLYGFITLPIQKYYHYSNSPNLENSPGSWALSYKELFQNPLPFIPFIGINPYERSAFINTFSAAALPYDPYANFNPFGYTSFKALEQQYGNMENFSPLDQIYHHDGNNQEHCYISDTYKSKFLVELDNATIY